MATKKSTAAKLSLTQLKIAEAELALAEARQRALAAKADLKVKRAALADAMMSWLRAQPPRTAADVAREYRQRAQDAKAAAVAAGEKVRDPIQELHQRRYEAEREAAGHAARGKLWPTMHR